jgi:hypothetical protein
MPSASKCAGIVSGLANRNQATVGTWNRALNQDESLVVNDLDDRQTLCGDLGVTILATHLSTFEDTGWECALTNGTRESFASVSMTGRLSTETVTLHYSSETATLGSAYNRYEFAFAEDIVIELLTNCDGIVVFCPEFSKNPNGGLSLQVSLGRAIQLAFSDFFKAQLNSIITITVFAFFLGDGHRADLQDSHGNHSPVILKNLRHANFTGQHSTDHGNLSWFEKKEPACRQALLRS